jgi:hypothetical protein
MQKTIEGLRNGDVESFNKIFNAYWRPLYLAAFNRVNDEQKAQDIV